MTAFRTGDIPTGPLLVVPTAARKVIDLDSFNAAHATLLDSSYSPVAGVTLTASIADGEVSVGWPTTSPFTDPGIYYVSIVLTGAGTISQTVDSVPLVVEQEDGWHTLATARLGWTTGGPKADEVLAEFLANAKTAVLAFAPTLADGDPVPAGWRSAQLLQARNTWNALKTDPSDSSSDPQAPIKPYPMDRYVKSLIRPAKGVPSFG